jgi:hypothetical protein
VAVLLSGEDVTLYPVIVLPPSEPGALKATLACALPAVATGPVGASGTVLGITDPDAAEATEFPAALVATTVKVYDSVVVKPVTTRGELAPVVVLFPGEDVTVYSVMVLPPVEVGGLNATLTCALPAVATGLVGAPGTVIGVTGADAIEATEFPAALVATTVNV